MPKLTEEKKALVEKLASEKKSVRQIAEETGISKTTIGTFLKNKKDFMGDSHHTEETDGTSVSLKINLVDTIPEGHMLDQKSVNSFLSSITEDKSPAALAKQTEPLKGGAFINNMVESSLSKLDIPEAEHFPRPLKGAKARAKVEKVVKQRAVKEVSSEPDVSPKVDSYGISKSDLIAKIHFNVNTFEALLKDVIKGDKEAFIKSLEKMSASSLENTLKLIESTRSIKNLSNQFLHFFWIGSTMIEMGSQQFLGLKTQGFTMALQQTQQEELRLIMQEIAMEQKDKFQKVQRPEIRLAMIMTTTLLAVNSNNSMMVLKQGHQRLNPTDSHQRLNPTDSQQPQQIKVQKAEGVKEGSKVQGQQAKVVSFVGEETKATYKDL